MGTTCACAWIVGRRLYTASVGDSRIYLLRGKTIRQLTTDHTWIQEAIDKGILKAEQARDHPNVHVIRRYLGSAKPPEPDLRLRMRRGESDTQAEANQGFLLYPGDRLLLCSDGLTDDVSDEGIRVAAYTPDLEFAAESLIELANSNGGHDNITAVLIEVPDKPRKKRRRIWPWILSAFAGLIFLLAVAGGLTWVIVADIHPAASHRHHPADGHAHPRPSHRNFLGDTEAHLHGHTHRHVNACEHEHIHTLLNIHGFNHVNTGVGLPACIHIHPNLARHIRAHVNLHTPADKNTLKQLPQKNVYLRGGPND
jgi:hypothetical protein